MAWTAVGTQNVEMQYRGETVTAKVQTLSYDAGGGVTLYKTVTNFPQGEVTVDLAAVGG